MSATSTAVAEIEERILTLRGRKVLLDSDLAALYGVSTGALMQGVRRNRARFPADFVFQLSNQEVANLRSQFVISSFRSSHGGRRHKPFAFTEQGVAMLSSVLRSPAAIAVNIEIMRAFVRLRRAALVSEQVVGLIAGLAKRVDDHDAAIKGIIETIRALIDAPKPSRRPIGFVPID
jgi:ORF6N domain-containing protein